MRANASTRNPNYVSFDFKNVTENGLKKVTNRFEKNDLKVVAVEANNRVIRQAGTPTKRAIFSMMDGQKVTLQITSEGAVFQVRLNARVIPVRNVSDLDRAIAEIADRVKANSAQFQKAQRRKIKKPEDATQRKASRARTSNKARLALFEQQANELQKNVDELEERKQSLSAQVSESTGQVDTLKGQIEEAKAENERLQSELVSLSEAA